MVGVGCKLLRGDKTPGMVVGGGESGAKRPIPLLPNQPVDGVISMPHMRQEIYSLMSSPHYAPKVRVKLSFLLKSPILRGDFPNFPFLFRDLVLIGCIPRKSHLK